MDSLRLKNIYGKYESPLTGIVLKLCRFILLLTVLSYVIPFQVFAKTACLSGTAVGFPSGQSLRVRSGPSGSDSVIGSLLVGSRFKVIGYETHGGVIEPDPEDQIDRSKPKNIWLKIAYIDSNGLKAEGWVNYQYVDCSDQKYNLGSSGSGDKTPTQTSGTTGGGEPPGQTGSSSCSDDLSRGIEYPVPSGTTGQAFKVPSDYMFCGYHTGTDINGSRGANIVAAADGVVVHIGNMWYQSSSYEDPVNGKGRGPMAIIIKHNPGLYTTYAHNSSVASGIKVGTCVKRGQVIAGLGSLGYSEGPHLHFEVVQGVDYTGKWQTPFPANYPDWGPNDPICHAYKNPAAYW